MACSTQLWSVRPWDWGPSTGSLSDDWPGPPAASLSLGPAICVKAQYPRSGSAMSAAHAGTPSLWWPRMSST
eukprot:5394008-Alexandrium_andersonii.AAC.1